MITADLKTIGLTEFWVESNPKQRCKATFPLFAAHGTTKTAAVYFEINPGEKLGAHTDSAEEMLYFIEGELEVTIGDESAIVSGGQLAVVPKLVLHDIKNVGTVPAKVLGIFGGTNNIVARFEEVWLPSGTNVVDTALLV